MKLSDAFQLNMASEYNDGAVYAPEKLPGRKTRLKEFMTKYICHELQCVRYLQKHQVLPVVVRCPGRRYELHRCSATMKVNTRKCKGKVIVYWRCTRRSCNTSRSIRSTTSFFTFDAIKLRSRSSLSLCSIMEMLYVFLHTRCTLDMAMNMVGHCRSTLCD